MTTTYLSQLEDLAEDLRTAELVLPSSLSRGPDTADCDEWCKLWMLLVGAWYSLSWSAYSVESSALREQLKKAHLRAVQLLDTIPASLSANDLDAWSAGYFLISGEHRVANVLDRATKQFFPRDLKMGIYTRSVRLLKQCPRCHRSGSAYLSQAKAALRAFAEPVVKSGDRRKMAAAAEERWLKGSALARVYDRVNTIKHKSPGADAVSELPTAQRWNDLREALKMLLALLRELATHAREH